MSARSPLIKTTSDRNALLTYLADLELEVDRLRKLSHFLQQETREAVERIQPLCTASADAERNRSQLCEIAQLVGEFAAVMRDVREPSDCHPILDQVVTIDVRPLADQVFRWQQRLLNSSDVILRFELEREQIQWFPARLRHILENLVSNSISYRDRSKGENRVTVGLRVLQGSYELRVTDNGLGLLPEEVLDSVEFFYRSARVPGLGVGLAVVKILVEQTGGTLTGVSGEGQGTTFIAMLPRYDLDDFLESSIIEAQRQCLDDGV